MEILIHDEESRPVDGAQVILLPERAKEETRFFVIDGEEGEAARLGDLFTNEDFAVFQGVTHHGVLTVPSTIGYSLVLVRGPGYADRLLKPQPEVESTLEVHLSSCATIRGTVKFESGNPASSLLVTAFEQGLLDDVSYPEPLRYLAVNTFGDEWPKPCAAAVTNEAGAFQIGRLAAGVYDIAYIYGKGPFSEISGGVSQRIETDGPTVVLTLDDKA